MGHSRQIYSNQNRALLSFALVLALLVQGMFAASGSCMMVMDDSATAQAQAMSHEGHDMSGHEGHDMAVASAQSDDEALERMYGHRCPPNGCDICDGKNCSQCSPSQFSAIVQKDPIFLKDIPLAIPELARVVAFIVSVPQWSLPPGRAPPQIS